MNSEEYLMINNKLQAQGRRLLDAGRFEALFSSYGDYQIGGSFRHGLMVDMKPDIDGYIVTDDVSIDRAMELAGRLLKDCSATRVAVETETGASKGVTAVALQIKVPFEGRKWNLDVHLIKEADRDRFDYLGTQTFSEEQRLAMLKIKAELVERRLYPGSTKLPGSLASIDVYRAVLQGGATNANEAVAWYAGRPTAADAWRATQ